MGEPLVLRWSFLSCLPAHVLMTGPWGVVLAGFTATLGSPGAIVLGAVGAGALLTYSWVVSSRPRLVLTDDECRVVGAWSTRTRSWASVTAVTWHEVWSRHTGHGWSPALVLSTGARRATRFHLPKARMRQVNAWLREHQPEIRIDPVVPWRDRFGVWHVVEPSFDPIETMTTLRMSHVGPWEIRARSCDGGFRAETRRVHGGQLVAHAPVRATLAEAKHDGVQLVREAIEAAGSTTE